MKVNLENDTITAVDAADLTTETQDDAITTREAASDEVSAANEEQTDFPSEEEQLEKLRQMQPLIRRECRNAVKFKPVYAVAKRIFDILASIFGLIVLAPFFAVVAHKIRKESPGPAIFKQQRVGKNGKVFMMYKFRSMEVDAEERLKSVLSKNKGSNTLLFKADDDDRITPYGRKIRDNSVDELPQLLNILKGDMSFVGPRPPLVREVIQYKDEYTVRLAVKGGLTCFWQLTGRNDADFEFCLAQDKKYLKKRGFWLDIILIFKTVFGIISGKSSGS